MSYRKKRYSLFVKCFAWAILAVGIERFCFLQTAGFRESKILSSLPYEEKWDTGPLSEERKKNLESILDQPFTYIGHGGTSYCFASQDNQYVIKFFKHQHIAENSLISQISLPEPFEKYRISYLKSKELRKKHKRREFLFSSFLLAQQNIPQETAIVHLQLNKSPEFKRNITLYDKIGVKHTIPLDQTEFILQRKADMLFPVLFKMIKENKTEEAKKAVDSLFANIKKRCEAGLSDRDPHLSINFGFVDGQVVEIDIGSFSVDKNLKSPLKQKEILTSVVKSLRKKMVRNNALELDAYIETKLERETP